jgi:hypothetical protein
LGAAVPAVLILIIVVITTNGHGTPKIAPPPAALPPLVQTFANRAMGATGRLPRGWTAVRAAGLLRLANRPGSAVIVIASVAARPNNPPPLLATSLASIRKSYGPVMVEHGNGTTLGGLPARSIVLFTRNKRGVPLRILLAAAQGKRLAYVLEAFTARSASVRDLTETQEAVSGLRLAG